jgi:hypothetical protein
MARVPKTAPGDFPSLLKPCVYTSCSMLQTLNGEGTVTGTCQVCHGGVVWCGLAGLWRCALRLVNDCLTTSRDTVEALARVEDIVRI